MIDYIILGTLLANAGLLGWMQGSLRGLQRSVDIAAGSAASAGTQSANVACQLQPIRNDIRRAIRERKGE
jgi:hypothetical protein